MSEFKNQEWMIKTKNGVLVLKVFKSEPNVSVRLKRL